jgi:exopolysaccharide biosynthesis polyprenyl glycosylphosphotransferase
MIRRHTTAMRAALMAADLAGAVALFMVASWIRYGGDWEEVWRRLGVDPWLAAAAYGSCWVVLLALQGMYRLRARLSLRGEATGLLRATLILAVATVVALFLVKVSDLSRLLLLALLMSQALIGIVSRVGLRAAFAWLRRRGHNTGYVLVVGANAAAQDFADRIESHGGLGLRVIGHLRARDGVSELLTRPVVGDLDDIEDVFHRQIVDEVAICLPLDAWDLVEPITRLCEDEGKIVRIPTAEHGPTIPGGIGEDFDGIHVLSLVYGPDRALSLALKRVLDVAIALPMLVLLSPLFLAVALRIRRTDGSPVLFRQERIGLHGRRFDLLKFRTMDVDAEERLADLEALNEVNGMAFKLTEDPRLTRSGPFLRRSSLDELPQLWNVLRGEMSLVGPRPPLPMEVDGYDIWHRRRLSMKPGITGLWQVTARREPEFDRWVQLDLEYIDRWSLLLDLKIMLRTLPVIVTQEGR